VNAELAAAYWQELTLATQREQGGDFQAALSHLERAHILGQRSTVAHVRTHWRMLRVGARLGDRREVRGQVVRIVAALLFSRIWVPIGNSGRANVSATKPMPIPADLRRFFER
jgi:hypothetical protein